MFSPCCRCNRTFLSPDTPAIDIAIQTLLMLPEITNLASHFFVFPPASSFLFALQTLLAVGITVYTALKLSNVSVTVDGVFGPGDTVSESFCALGNTSDYNVGGSVGNITISTSSIASSNCLLLEILGGVTIAIGIVIAVIQCYTCNLCGMGGVLDFIFGVIGSAAWLAAAIIITGVYSDNKDSPDGYSDRREVVMIMTWVEFGLFASIVLAAVLKCCCCCGGRSKSDVDV